MMADLGAGPTPMEGTKLVARGVSVTFSERQQGVVRTVHAVRDVDIDVIPGHVVGVVGESGSGKSTLARTLVGLQPPTKGTVRCGAIDVGAGSRRNRRSIGRLIAMVFQDPRSSLNPRLTVGAVVADPLVVHRQGSREERGLAVRKLLSDVGLSPAVASRPVRALSGGQLQRVAIARALSLRPDFIVADEPTSALDVSVQAQILNLLKDLQDDYGFGMLMISHDMRVMRAMTDELIVMLEGAVVERGPTAQVFSQPKSAYAQQLISATPVLSKPSPLHTTTHRPGPVRSPD